jgi:hypothetical protein
MSRFQPALLGGLFIGVISALPVVGSANLCCCLWVVAGGALTVYLLQQGQPAPVETAEAALQGLIAGALGGVIYVAAFAGVVTGLMGLNVEEQVRAALDRNAQLPEEVRTMVLNLVSGPSFLVLVAAVTVPVYALFSMLGSLLGLALFKKKTPPDAELRT